MTAALPVFRRNPGSPNLEQRQHSTPAARRCAWPATTTPQTCGFPLLNKQPSPCHRAIPGSASHRYPADRAGRRERINTSASGTPPPASSPSAGRADDAHQRQRSTPRRDAAQVRGFADGHPGLWNTVTGRRIASMPNERQRRRRGGGRRTPDAEVGDGDSDLHLVDCRYPSRSTRCARRERARRQPDVQPDGRRLAVAPGGDLRFAFAELVCLTTNAIEKLISEGRKDITPSGIGDPTLPATTGGDLPRLSISVHRRMRGFVFML